MEKIKNSIFSFCIHIALWPNIIFLLCSCSISKKAAKELQTIIAEDSAFQNAHVGISVFNPEKNEYLFNLNETKYFVPASNTKILTCYAGMKYLGDSLVGLRYEENDTTLQICGTGDPSFLWSEFKNQPVLAYLKNIQKKIYLDTSNWRSNFWGLGWSWTDFTTNYTQERSAFPIEYNSISTNELKKTKGNQFENYLSYYFKNKIKGNGDSSIFFSVTRNSFQNQFEFKKAKTNSTVLVNIIPDFEYIKLRLQKEIQQEVNLIGDVGKKYRYSIKTQPTDSVLKPMMHRSDNFFAEQSLLMVSNKKLGYMNDDEIINYIKKNDFAGIPQMPRWVDGSGLSRYNMFTPQSIVWVLNKMRNEFGMQRLKEIFPTGGEGTITNFYKNIQGKIFAKTGTLSNHVALSGFLFTKNGTFLIFSTLISGYQGSATPSRKAIEKFLIKIYEKY